VDVPRQRERHVDQRFHEKFDCGGQFDTIRRQSMNDVESGAAAAPQPRGSGSSRLSRSNLVGALLLAAGIAISIPLFSTPGTFDVTLPRYGFLTWMDEAVRHGVRDGYRLNPYDYPPGTKVLLGIAGATGDRLGLSRPTSFKTLLFLFHNLTTLVALAATRNLLLAGLIHVTTVLSAIALGYLDVLYAPFLVLSLVALQRDWKALAWGLLCLSCTVKPQPLILAPFYLVHLGRIGGFEDAARLARSPRAWLGAGTTAAAALAFVLAFGRTDDDQWAVLQAMQKATAHNEISGNAMNAGWIGSYVYQVARDGELGPARLRDITWTREIKLVAAAILVSVLWLQIRLRKTPQTALLALLAGYLAYFTFNAGVHENHVFIAMLLAVVLLAGFRRRGSVDSDGRLVSSTTALDASGRMTMAGVVVFAHLNLFLFYGWNGETQPPVLLGGEKGLDLSVLLAPASIVLFVSTVRCLLRTARQLEPRRVIARNPSREGEVAI
jgi:hypothetical protein